MIKYLIGLKNELLCSMGYHQGPDWRRSPIEVVEKENKPGLLLKGDWLIRMCARRDRNGKMCKKFYSKVQEVIV